MIERREQIEDRLIEAEENLLIDTLFFIEELMREKGLDRSSLAKTMGVSKARLSQLLSPSSNPTLKSLARIFAAIGEEVTFVPKATARNVQTGDAASLWQESSRKASEAVLAEVGGWTGVRRHSNDNPCPIGFEILMAVA